MAALCAGLPVMRNQRFPHMGTKIFFTKALQNRHKILVDFHTNSFPVTATQKLKSVKICQRLLFDGSSLSRIYGPRCGRLLQCSGCRCIRRNSNTKPTTYFSSHIGQYRTSKSHSGSYTRASNCIHQEKSAHFYDMTRSPLMQVRCSGVSNGQPQWPHGWTSGGSKGQWAISRPKLLCRKRYQKQSTV